VCSTTSSSIADIATYSFSRAVTIPKEMRPTREEWTSPDNAGEVITRRETEAPAFARLPSGRGKRLASAAPLAERQNADHQTGRKYERAAGRPGAL
jgi:hypothetical protein